MTKEEFEEFEAITAEMQCPYCSGTFQGILDSAGKPAMTHTLPTCLQFNEDNNYFIRAIAKNKSGGFTN